MQVKQITGALLGICILLAGADYLFKERLKPTSNEEIVAQEKEQKNIPQEKSVSSSSATKIVKKGKSTKKKGEVSLDIVAEKIGYTITQNSEKSLLHRMLSGAIINTSILLSQETRLCLIAYIEDPGIKETFAHIKEQLAKDFSTNVILMTDETKEADDHLLAAEILRFQDPSISTDVITFVRIRSRLYELHSSQEKSAEIDALVEVLRER
jgi:hypothetical protein